MNSSSLSPIAFDRTLSPNAPGAGRSFDGTAGFSPETSLNVTRRGGGQLQLVPADHGGAGRPLARLAPPSLKGSGQDPFAAYLAWRPKPKHAHGHEAKTWVSPLMGTTRNLISDSVPVSFFGRVPNAEDDPYSSFMSTRPKPPEPSKETSQAELKLREDVLRTKRQLLEVALQAELKLLDPSCPADAAARMKQLRRAKRYLRNPERVTTVLSDDEDEEEFETRGRRVGFDDDKGRAAGSTSSPSGRLRSQTALGSSASAPELVSALAGSRNLRNELAAAAAGTGAAAAAAAPEVCEDAEGKSSGQGRRRQLLPPIATAGGEEEAASSAAAASAAAAARSPAAASSSSAAPGGGESGGAASPSPSPERHQKREPLLSGWWSQTRLWNLQVVKKGLVARRHHWASPGGAVVLGNGRVPLFTGSQMLHPGNYFCFRITSIDDVNHPLHKVGDMAFAFGVSRVPAHDRSCEKPQYAYEIPAATVCGYGDKFIDQGRWHEGGWDPRCLKLDDEVGVLITMHEGDMVVFHNDQQVLRMKTSFGEDNSSSAPSSPTGGGGRGGTRLVKRMLWPIVDLHGRVAAVTLQLRKGPPNVPLQRRSKMTRAGVSDVLPS